MTDKTTELRTRLDDTASPQSSRADADELLVPAGLLKPEPVVPLETIAALLESDPKAVIKLLEERDLRLAELHAKKEDNVATQEAYKHRESLAKETTNRLSLGLIFATIASILVYAGITNDKTAFDKILTASLGAFGGAGAVVTFANRSKP
jgi:hypothetical protein